MRTLAIAVLAAVSGCASVPEDDPHVLRFNDAELAICAADGGCVVMSRGQARRLLKKAMEDAGCGVDTKRGEAFNPKGTT